MKLPLVALFLTGVAPMANAQLSLVAQTRFVSASAQASDAQGNPPVTSADRIDALNAAPFDENLTVTSSTADANAFGTARQTSTIGATSIVATGFGTAGAGSSDLTGTASGSASSMSGFTVTFDVLTAATYTLDGSIANTDNAEPFVRLETASGAVVAEVVYPGNAATTPFDFTGMLPAGRYTLSAEASGSATGNAFFFFSDNSSFDVEFEIVPQPIGFSDCPAPASNSSGTSATLSASGSNLVSRADLILEVQGAIPNQFGLFFYGTSEAPMPFGGGSLCLAAPLYRLSQPIQADAMGTAAYTVDFGAWPVNAGAGAWTSGSTWAFQYWYRDAADPSGFTASERYTIEFR